MIPLLALLLAVTPATVAGPADPRPEQARFDDCVKLADGDAAKAISTATIWAKSGGGIPATQCLGVAYSSAGDWTSAAQAFSAAASAATEARDGRAANLWVAAGNAALAGGDAARARAALTSALALPVMPDPMRGEAYLDRARAGVAANDLPAARSDMNEALKLVAADPMAWLLSATLARRMGDVTRATADIQEAEDRAPNEAPILYEAGNIAATAGDMPHARIQWARARAGDPDGDTGKAATKELAATGGLDVAMPPAASVVGR